MTIDKLKKERQILEQAISDLCLKFEERTGQRISKLGFGDVIVTAYAGQPYLPQWWQSRKATVEVKL